MRHFFISTILLLASFFCHAATIPSDNKIRLDDSWEFLRSDLGSTWEAVRPASKGSSESVPKWTGVSLPHCFNAFDAVDPDVNYYQGPGWYRRQMTFANPYPGGRTIIEFEGAGQKTKVWIGETLVGEHVGGYDGWSVDITDALAGTDGPQWLVVRCDNSRDTEMIPSDLSDFNVYGGLYRHVNLIYLPATYVSGIKICPQRLSDKKWLVPVEATVSGAAGTPVTVSIFSPDGECVSSSTAVAGEDGLLSLNFDIRKPKLWSPSEPELYQCRFEVGDFIATEAFGLRSFTFVDHGPFLLNGERLLLRGTHRHEDHAGTGAAVPDDITRREMVMMKDMGVNFIRLGHYQQSELVLHLCDSLGILVWEEIPWCRGGLGGDTYKAQARRMLGNMISQHRNHPSVIIWGLGNENDWKGDFHEFDTNQIRAFMSELNDLAHKLDPERKTAIRRCSFCADIVDVYSPSIWAGWYRGLYTDYKSVTEKEMSLVPHFLHVEWGGDSHAGRHSENAFNNLSGIQSGDADERAGDASLYGGQSRASKDGDWSESYIVRLIDWHLKEQETIPNLTGTASWLFKDFSTPVRPDNPIPYVNQKGIVDRALAPKESYYVYQSYWTEKPMAHIYGHTWPVRWGKPAEMKEILVYSNCDKAELFVNGVSQGVRTRDSQNFPAAGLRWNCQYKEGENVIEVVATKGKETVKDRIVQQYQTAEWGKEAKLLLSVSEGAEPGIKTVNVLAVDANGVPCLDSKIRVRFSYAGAGRMLDNLGTQGGSRLVQLSCGRSSIAIKTADGQNAVAVSAEGLETEVISF